MTQQVTTLNCSVGLRSCAVRKFSTSISETFEMFQQYVTVHVASPCM